MEQAELLKIFSDRLRDLISDSGLGSIKAFATKLGIPSPTVNRWINMTRSPKFEYLYLIAKTFNVTTDFLLGLKDY